jgi:hypothetical protein
VAPVVANQSIAWRSTVYGAERSREALFISRGAKSSYRVETREDRRSDVVVILMIRVQALRAHIDREVAKLR